MNVLKFRINEDYFDKFKEICTKKEITVKQLLFDTMMECPEKGQIANYLPEDFNENLRNLTLKVNNGFFKTVAKKSTQLDISVRDYMPYLVYRCLHENNMI